MDERQNPGTPEYEALPVAEITINQVIAWNMRRWRLASDMRQDKLGELIGWSAANVSAAERSVEEHRDRRRFDAQTIADIADALSIPIVALYLPPEDDGVGKRYQWRTGGGDVRDMRRLMDLDMHDNEDDSEAMADYRDRYRGAVAAYLDEKWGDQVSEWFAPPDDAGARAQEAARFRARQAVLLRFAAEDAALAEGLERPVKKP